MGWTLSAAVTKLPADGLEAAAQSVYGRGARLKATDKTVEHVISRSAAHATEFGGHVWLTDIDRQDSWLETPPATSGTWLAFGVLDTVNFYGFTLYREGQIIRQRIGMAEQGIVSDKGGLLPAEEAALDAMAPDDAPAARAAWTDATRTVYLPALDFHAHHHEIGSEIAFAVAADFTGFNLMESRGWFETPVQRIKTPFFRWFG